MTGNHRLLMEFREVQQDLFSVGSEYHLVHCISSDKQMDAGIAYHFNKKFKIRSLLAKKSEAELKHPTCIKTEGTRVFNLITKERYWNIPTYENLEEALIQMKNQIVKEKITKLAMPKIASGLDKKKWEKVREIIKKVFKDTDVEIMVCYIQ